MTSLVGQTIKHYRIVEQIAQTPLTTVYRGQDETTQDEVAIKVIRSEAFSTQHLEDILGRFKKSARAIISLTHPHIVKLLDYGIHKKSPYLVMEYIAGEPLKAHTGTPMHWYEAARLLAPLARALDYAHTQGVVHGDVKPANILISHEGNPMLTDFGMTRLLAARGASALESSNMGIGASDYMAPEQLSSQVQPATDIYSLGIVFYQLVTGRVPFHANTPAVGLLKHVDDPLPDPRELNSDLPDDVVDILKTVLEKQPQERFGSMGGFASTLEKLLQDTPPPAVIHVPETTMPRVTPRTILLYLGALVILAAAIYLASHIRLRPAAVNPSPSPSASVAATTTSETANTPGIVSQEVPMPTLPNTTITYSEDFDLPRPPGWVMKVDSAIQDGSLRIVGQGNWQDLSQATRQTALHERDAALILFRYKSAASFDIYLHSSTQLTGGTNSALEWGISVLPDGELKTHVYQGEADIGGEWWQGSLVPQPDHVYPLLLRVGGKEEFVARLWDIQNPDVYLEMHRSMPAAWSGLGWDFIARAYNGMLNLDNYQEIHFD